MPLYKLTTSKLALKLATKLRQLSQGNTRRKRRSATAHGHMQTFRLSGWVWEFSWQCIHNSFFYPNIVNCVMTMGDNNIINRCRLTVVIIFLEGQQCMVLHSSALLNYWWVFITIIYLIWLITCCQTFILMICVICCI